MVGKELIASLQQLVAVQRDELAKYRQTSNELGEAHRQIRGLQARAGRAEQERSSQQRRLDEERSAKEALQGVLDGIEARHEAELRAQLERLCANRVDTALVDTQQWLKSSIEAERDAALAEELRLNQRAHERKLFDISHQFETRIHELTEARDKALDAAETERQRADELVALLRRTGTRVPADLAGEPGVLPDMCASGEGADATTQRNSTSLTFAWTAAPAALPSAEAADLMKAADGGPCMALAHALGLRRPVGPSANAPASLPPESPSILTLLAPELPSILTLLAPTPCAPPQPTTETGGANRAVDAAEAAAAVMEQGGDHMRLDGVDGGGGATMGGPLPVPQPTGAAPLLAMAPAPGSCAAADIADDKTVHAVSAAAPAAPAMCEPHDRLVA